MCSLCEMDDGINRSESKRALDRRTELFSNDSITKRNRWRPRPPTVALNWCWWSSSPVGSSIAADRVNWLVTTPQQSRAEQRSRGGIRASDPGSHTGLFPPLTFGHMEHGRPHLIPFLGRNHPSWVFTGPPMGRVSMWCDLSLVRNYCFAFFL